MATLFLVPQVVDVTDKHQLTTFCHAVQVILNGAINNGQLTRTAQDTYVLGGGGGPPLDVASGGTGDSNLTAHAVLIGEGTSPVAFAGPGLNGQVLIGAGSKNDPFFSEQVFLGNSTNAGQLFLKNLAGDFVILQFAGGSGNYNFNYPATAGTAGQPLLSGGGGASDQTYGTLSVGGGGTGRTTLTNHGVLVGAGTSAITQLSVGTTGQVLTGVTGADPVFAAVPLTVGTTTITSGTSGRVLYDNAGVLGEMTTTGTGTQLVLSAGPTLTGTVVVAGWTFATANATAASFNIKNTNGVTCFASTDNIYAQILPGFGTRTDTAASISLGTTGTGFNWAPNAANTIIYAVHSAVGEVNCGASNSGGTFAAFVAAVKKTSTTGLSKSVRGISVGTTTNSATATNALAGLTENAYIDVDGVVGCNNLTLADAGNVAVGTGTGTKIGTATSQKLSLWNATPIVQPTTAVAGATRVGGGGAALTDTDTFDGYTVAQVVKALRNIGALA